MKRRIHILLLGVVKPRSADARQIVEILITAFIFLSAGSGTAAAAGPVAAATPASAIISATKDRSQNVYDDATAGAAAPGTPHSHICVGIVFNRIDERIKFFGITQGAFIAGMFAGGIDAIGEQYDCLPPFDVIERLINYLIDRVIKTSPVPWLCLPNRIAPSARS